MTSRTQLSPNDSVDAPRLRIPLAAVPGSGVQVSTSEAGSVTIGEFGSLRLGVWEITPGVSEDVEVDEVFVVLAGSATVELIRERRSIELTPGSVCQFSAGTHTRWSVHSTLRKVYFL